MVSSYRFSGPLVLRLLGGCLAVLGVLAVLLAVVFTALSLPRVVLGVALALVLVVAVLAGLVATRRPEVVRLDDAGYRIRFVRGAGVRRAAWSQVEDAAAETIVGQRCVVLRLRDGRTTTIPVEILAGSPEGFVHDLQRRLDGGQGVRSRPSG